MKKIYPLIFAQNNVNKEYKQKIFIHNHDKLLRFSGKIFNHRNLTDNYNYYTRISDSVLLKLPDRYIYSSEINAYIY